MCRHRRDSHTHDSYLEHMPTAPVATPRSVYASTRTLARVLDRGIGRVGAGDGPGSRQAPRRRRHSARRSAARAACARGAAAGRAPRGAPRTCRHVAHGARMRSRGPSIRIAPVPAPWPHLPARCQHHGHHCQNKLGTIRQDDTIRILMSIDTIRISMSIDTIRG